MTKKQHDVTCTSPSHAAPDFIPTPPMLVNEIARLFHARMRKFAPPTDSVVMQQESARLLMRELGREEGVSQLHLVAATHLKPPTVSVTLRRMEEEDLVRRENDPMDLRFTRVYLTEKGKMHNKCVIERLHELDGELMNGFDEEETELLRRLLFRMRDNILPDGREKHTEKA